MSIHYRISLDRPEAHLFHVELEVKKPRAGEWVFMLPAWLPGSYMIRDMAGELSAVTARVDDTEWDLDKVDKTTWMTVIPETAKTISISYDVFAQDNSVRRAWLDTQRGFFNASSLCLLPLGLDQEPVKITIKTDSDFCRKWSLATTLTPVKINHRGFGTYFASDYEELIDSPVEMGTWEAIEFKAFGVPHRIIVSGAVFPFDRERLRDDIRRACETVIAFFDPQHKKAPFDHYDFYLNLSSDAYGGLEHSCSTALIASRFDLPRKDTAKDDEAYVRLLGLFTHEYFHAWWVKRVKPAIFIPYDLRFESYSRLLWVFEGFTSYYDHLLLRRAGLIDEKTYCNYFAGLLTRHMSASARHRQSLAESSFDAWIKYYKVRTNRANSVVSYYDKGALVAYALDATIRQKTQDKKSLDDVLRHAWTLYVEAGDDYAGVDEESMGELFVDAAGINVDELIDRWVYHTEEPDYESLLAQDGATVKKTSLERCRSIFGMTVGGETTLAVRSIDDASPAQKAGIAEGDELVAIAGIRVKKTSWERLLVGICDSKKVRVELFRDDRLLSFDVHLRQALLQKYELLPKQGN